MQRDQFKHTKQAYIKIFRPRDRASMVTEASFKGDGKAHSSSKLRFMV